MDLAETRKELLSATMLHVAFDGWTETALQAGARDAGLSSAEALNAFPGGARELLEAFSESIDEEMLVALEARDPARMRVRDRIAAGVRTRLELLAPHKEAVRRGMAFLALPQNALLGPRLLWRTVDAIWYAAGDVATDHNYYSKRALLAGVYGATLLYWLNDSSEGQSATWAFLERRIDEALKVGGGAGRVVSRLLNLPDAVLRPRRGLLRRRSP